MGTDRTFLLDDDKMVRPTRASITSAVCSAWAELEIIDGKSA
jgi:hypothetical protein